MLAGCGSMPYKEKDISDIETGDIVMIISHKNWAWGYQNSGNFIDRYGKVYQYDFSELPPMTFEQELEQFSDIMEQSEGTESNFSENDMKYIYSMLNDVDENADFKTENIMCDYGQETLFGIRYDESNQPEKIMIYSYGDNERKPLDRNSQKIYDYYISKIK